MRRLLSSMFFANIYITWMSTSPLTLEGDWVTGTSCHYYSQNLNHLGKNYGADQNTQRKAHAVLCMQLSQTEMQNKYENTLQTGENAQHVSISHIGLLAENRDHNRIHHDVVIRHTKYFVQLTSPTRLDSQECCCGTYKACSKVMWSRQPSRRMGK